MPNENLIAIAIVLLAVVSSLTFDVSGDIMRLVVSAFLGYLFGRRNKP